MTCRRNCNRLSTIPLGHPCGVGLRENMLHQSHHRHPCGVSNYCGDHHYHQLSSINFLFCIRPLLLLRHQQTSPSSSVRLRPPGENSSNGPRDRRRGRGLHHRANRRFGCGLPYFDVVGHCCRASSRRITPVVSVAMGSSCSGAML